MVQMLPQQVMGYDRAITVFSPDGRLLQVEYAKKAVSQGAMALGIVCKDGVLLMADRRILDKLLIPESVVKIFKIDDKIATTFSGLTSDARVLVKRCRVEAQQNKLTYGENIDVEGIVKFVSDAEQLYTQFGGARPYGISLLVGGCDKKGCHLFVTEPSGIYSKYKAKAIGAGAVDANKLLEKKYKENLTVDAAKKIAIEIFKEVLAAEYSLERLEAMKITEKGVNKLTLNGE